MAQYALISTEKGDMKAELYTEETPGTVANFVELANHNFYDGLTFHRVIPGFVIQGGCPRGDGTGGPGYKIKCETSAPRQYHDRGVLSMAHAGKDTGGSQFFICCARESTQHLDGRPTPPPGDVEPPERSEFCWMLVDRDISLGMICGPEKERDACSNPTTGPREPPNQDRTCAPECWIDRHEPR